jgi:hypothetical protein
LSQPFGLKTLREGRVINWDYFPRSDKPTALALSVVAAFEAVADDIDSATHAKLESNQVLAKVEPQLTLCGFQVETGKTAAKKIRVPVLFGRNGRLEKAFDADAYYEAQGFVVEVEAGRGVTNNQFLKDLFQACMMHGVKYLAIAVRNVYRENPDFERAEKFFQTLYASNRLKLPLDGILLIGY